MLKIYFGEVLINEDGYAAVTNDYKLFNDSFYLGSTASNTFNLKVLKSEVSSHPSDVTIEDENTTFHLIVDKVEEDKGFYNYTLVDKMVNFNFNYDAEPLIDEKTVLEEEAYLSDILEDMCLKAGVELDYTLTNDIIVSWYDNRIQAREYLSFIAELEGGYACINELGKLTIKQHKQASKKSITTDEVSELIVGEKKTITRVVYDNGVVIYEFGDDTGNTLYLNQNNVFITDELVAENIYNKIVGFEFYAITVSNSLIDSSIKAGDVITFIDGEDEYPTIAQYSSSYGGGWSGSYDFNINTAKQEETQILGLENKVKSIKTIVDRESASLAIIAEQTSTNSIAITDTQNLVGDIGTDLANATMTADEAKDNSLLALEGVETLEGTTAALGNATTDLTTRMTYQESTVSDLVLDIDGVKQSMTYSGGYNLIENCVKQFGEAGWEGTFENYSNTEIQQNSLTKSALVFMNDTETRETQTENRVHNFSFKYKKLVPLATATITINGVEIELTEDEWTEVEQNIEVTDNLVTIEYSSDADNSVWLVDPLLIPGNIKQIWTPNPNEINTGVIKLGGDTLTIESTSSSTVFAASTDGTRVYNVNDLNNPIAEFTSEGVETNKITGKNGDIGNVLITNMGNQTWFSRM